MAKKGIKKIQILIFFLEKLGASYVSGIIVETTVILAISDTDIAIFAPGFAPTVSYFPVAILCSHADSLDTVVNVIGWAYGHDSTGVRVPCVGVEADRQRASGLHIRCHSTFIAYSIVIVVNSSVKWVYLLNK